LEVRTGGPGDTAAVLDVHRRAFGEHGGDHGEVVAGLVEALLRDDPAASSVVAEDGGEVVGHVLISRSLLDAPRRLVEVGVLSPLGVRPDRQGRGIGAALVRRGLELADERRVPVVFLEGSPRYYSRLGFRLGADLGFRKPSLRIPDAGFQAVTLTAYEPWMTGTLVYASAFWEHDCVGLREPDGPEGP
jgi:putative acetyltransferase